MVVPLFKVYMAPDVGDYILPVLHSGYIGDGERVMEFEKKFGELIQNKNTVMVNSGTSAIVMALKLAGVDYGDRVITTPMTCLATNMAILSLGAIPVWADILNDGTIDPESVAEKYDPDIKAIICVDWGGTPCRLDELKQSGIPLIEDACQAIGSVYKEKPVGNHADFVCFSFQAIKQLTTGDGGMLVINYDDDGEIYKKAKLMRWFGLDRNNGASMRCTQDPPIWGYKFQSNDIATSIGLANIRHIKEIIGKAQRNAMKYDKTFSLKREQDRLSGSWLYTIMVDDVKDFINYMGNQGVECSPVHDRNDKKSVFKEFETDLPGVDCFDKHHVCIPVGWWVDNVDEIAELVVDYGN